MSATKTTIIAVLALVLTFTVGFVAGFAVHRVMGPPGPGHAAAPRMMLRHLDFRLGLTDAQSAQIEAILERRHQRISEIRDTTRPRMLAEINAANAEIEKVLTPEQREKFASMRLRLGHPGGRGRKGPPR